MFLLNLQSEDESHKITIAIIGYLRSLGYHSVISGDERNAALLISWVQPEEEVSK